MDTFTFHPAPGLSRFVARVLAFALLAFAGGAALAQADPPARVGNLSRIEGSVVYAPAGETEWADAVVNRPIAQGDRLWTDRGARAELHLGSSALHLDDESYLDVTALDDRSFQASMREGTLNARVRELDAGENFEIDTPNLALRASQPGDYRIDVDPAEGTTRVTVRQGSAMVYGAGGQGQAVQAGQQVIFRGRDLERGGVNSPPLDDGFDHWAADLNRREDQSIAARYVPRDVVGYQQLDSYGQWSDDPTYGAVWYPTVTVADWAPYRYGRWDWIAPWGWTWIDDAPWGFAPFHYGRWAVIRSRWCWVPGRIGPRPVYAPALVAFAGGDGGASWSLSVGSGPGIGWFPLAPGEAWRPAYRASPVYVRNVNRYIGAATANAGYIHQHRPGAWTAVRVDDFQRGRPVSQHWRSLGAADLPRTPITGPSALPQPRRSGDFGRPSTGTVMAPQPPSASVAPRPFNEPGSRSLPGRSGAPQVQDHQRPAWRDPQFQQQQDTQRQQMENRQRQDVQRQEAQRQQMEIRQRQDLQRQEAQRQQMEIRQRQDVQRQQQEQARQQFEVQRQQQAAREQAMRREEFQRQRGVRQPQQQQAPVVVPQQGPAMAPQQAPRGEVHPQRGWERRQQPQVREEGRPQGTNDNGPGRGYGHGPWGRSG